MLVMSAKLDKKKVALVFTAVILVIAGLVYILSGQSQTTATSSVSDNEARVEFLKTLGWEVAATPVESSQVKIPQEHSDILDRYNALQKSQGYDLTQFAGKTAMRYVYQIKNHPTATEPVYATVLVYKGQIIGGDITDTSPKGKIQPLKPIQSES